MDRRSLVLGSLSAAGAAVAASVFEGKAMASTGANATLIDATSKCIAVGLVCAAHCQKEFAKGNKEMAACHATVTDMLASCEALQKLAATNSKHLKAFAKVCADVCRDCAKACEPHKMMQECKDCHEACLACEKACVAA